MFPTWSLSTLLMHQWFKMVNLYLMQIQFNCIETVSHCQHHPRLQHGLVLDLLLKGSTDHIWPHLLQTSIYTCGDLTSRIRSFMQAIVLQMDLLTLHHHCWTLWPCEWPNEQPSLFFVHLTEYACSPACWPFHKSAAPYRPSQAPN